MRKTVQVYGFPSVVSPETVKDSIEQLFGEGTVYAVEIGEAKAEKPRISAKVQFTSPTDAEKFIIWAKSGQLWYEKSYLKGREAYLDLVPKPRMFSHSMDGATLHFGCQLSEQSFFVLWKCKNVFVKFGLGMKNLYFFLSHLDVDYKLELFHENIWQIELHKPFMSCESFLIIQLLGAPRVYQKDVSPLHFFKEACDEQWIRDVDFTPSFSIGQSSALCLELPRGVDLPNLEELSVFYKESRERYFTLEKGYSFSGTSNPHLVPIVDIPKNIELPYKIVFKINVLVQQGCLPGPKVDDELFRMVDPSSWPIEYIEHALEKLFYRKECCYEPLHWLKAEYTSYRLSGQIPASPRISLDDGLIYVHRVQVTPSKVYFCGPEVNVSNRVIRQFASDVDNFLRVTFVDEELEKIHSASLSSHASDKKQTGIYERILSVLRNGIVIGKKRFEFLAFSSSQLKRNSVWMFASRLGLTASDIRFWMGDFSQLRNVAKYAARLGQSFSSSWETMNVRQYEIDMIPDIVTETDGSRYVFSDGIGKISAELAKEVARTRGLTSVPSAFQIRYGGYKGVVAVDPKSSGKLSLRKSMLKYKSSNTQLDVLSWSRYQPCFLNRQLITLLSTLGVKDRVFEKKQKEVIAQLHGILTNPFQAREALELMSTGENTVVLKEMLNCGYRPDEEPFLSMMFQAFRASKLFDLRIKSRIFIPRGRLMMGCLDETRTLEYGEVFVQISELRSRCSQDDSSSIKVYRTSRGYIIKGKIVVAKNPCLHPGDVRVLNAVIVPALQHMVDCVVFPQKGRRPHPNECSGSDLDGDNYFVCWDPELIPFQQEEPMDYTPAPNTLLDRNITIEDVQRYFVDYMVNDNLGRISNAHVVFADKEPSMAFSDPCLELAELCSIAVDFSKTGTPARVPPHLRAKEYPDFMEKTDKPTYESQRVIGKLFREVRDVALGSSHIISFTREVARRAYDRDMEVDGYKSYVHEAMHYKTMYDFKLRNLMDYYGIKSEAEILSGNITKISRSFDRKRDLETIGYAVRALRKEARKWFNENHEEAWDIHEDEYARASAWYRVTYHPKYWGLYGEGLNHQHFLSFPWIVYDKLIEIKKKKISARRTSSVSSIGNQLLQMKLADPIAWGGIR